MLEDKRQRYHEFEAIFALPLFLWGRERERGKKRERVSSVVRTVLLLQTTRVWFPALRSFPMPVILTAGDSATPFSGFLLPSLPGLVVCWQLFGSW